MNWRLVVGLSLLGCVGQLRAQPTSWRPAESQLAYPYSPFRGPAPAAPCTPLGLATDLRAAWLAATAEPAADSEATALPAARAEGRAVSVAIERPAAARRPAPDFLQVQVVGLTDEINVRLLNNRGRVVRRQRSRSPVRLAVGSLMPGHYFLLATDAAGELLTDCQCVVIEP